MLEGVLQRAHQVAQEAEVFAVERRDEPVLFEANQLKLVERRDTTGVALRLVKDGRIGFASTTNLEGVEELVSNALEMAPFGPVARLEFPTLTSFPTAEVYDPEVESLPLEEMVHLGQSLIDRVRAHNTELLCDAQVRREHTTVRLLNSRGGCASYTESGFSVFIEGTLIRDTDMLFLGDGKSSCRPLLDIADLEESLARQLEYTRQIAPAPVGRVPVVFTPRGVAGALLGPLLAGFNGRAVLQGVSPLVGKLGEHLLDPKLSLRDDPLIPYATGSRMCDDEGVPSRRVSLIEGGTIASFLYDLQTAAEAGVESTASAHRSLGSLPSPGTSVIILEEGQTPFQDILADMEEGLVVERFLGAGQGNTMGGEFSANVLLGYRVEKGKIVGRVKNTLISGNVYTVLKEVAAVARESEWVGGSLKLPALYCRNVAVATKA
ncbi:MAG: TldD/PmbA family protein [Dehalococcoidia bacterium]